MRAFSASASAPPPPRIASPSCLLPVLRSARSSLVLASSSRRRVSAARMRSIGSVGSPLRATAALTASGSSRIDCSEIMRGAYRSRPPLGAAR